MYSAVRDGIVQTMIGESALAFQRQVDSGEQTIVGVNAYQSESDERPSAILERPDPERMSAQLDRLRQFKRQRDPSNVRAALDRLSDAANDERQNVYARVVEAALAGVTHGEIVACLRGELGDGNPMIVA